MKKEGAGVFPKKEIEKAKDIVRIEIRCKEGKIQALKKSYNVNSIAGFMRRGEEIGRELYGYYLKKIFNEGTIWTLREAIDRVERSEYKKKDIELLKSFLKDCNNERSVAKALKYYRNYYGKAKVKKLTTMLDDIDTNYVTVTNVDIKLFDSGYIPTPYELYKEFME